MNCIFISAQYQILKILFITALANFKKTLYCVLSFSVVEKKLLK